MPSPQYYLEVVDGQISSLDAATCVATALNLGETEIKLIDKSILCAYALYLSTFSTPCNTLTKICKDIVKIFSKVTFGFYAPGSVEWRHCFWLVWKL